MSRAVPGVPRLQTARLAKTFVLRQPDLRSRDSTKGKIYEGDGKLQVHLLCGGLGPRARSCLHLSAQKGSPRAKSTSYVQMLSHSRSFRLSIFAHAARPRTWDSWSGSGPRYAASGTDSMGYRASTRGRRHLSPLSLRPGRGGRTARRSPHSKVGEAGNR